MKQEPRLATTGNLRPPGRGEVNPYKIAKVLRVVREGTGTPSRLYIDGELFEYATVDGYSVHPKRNDMPGVTVTIAAWRVELVDDMDAAPGELSPNTGSQTNPEERTE